MMGDGMIDCMVVNDGFEVGLALHCHGGIECNLTTIVH